MAPTVPSKVAEVDLVPEMELPLCRMFQSKYGNMSVNMTYYEKPPETSIQWYEVVIPAVCAFGVIGNILNLVVLTKQRIDTKMDRLEKSATYGLIALAFSDMLVCVLVFPTTFLDQSARAVPHWQLPMLYYRLHGISLLNLFIMNSTWLIVYMAIGRFIVVAYPFYARIALSTKRGFCAIISIHILSTVMTLPMLLHIRIRACRDASNLLMYQYRPRFQMPIKLYMLEYVKWVWPIIAVFIPLVVMTVINARLIRELSNAKKSRRRSCRGQVVRDKHQKITLTLVIIVLMFLVLVAPSEILRYVNPYKYWGKISYTIASVANVMQAVNFAFNFVLYCAVSASFRQTLSSLFFRRKQNPPGPETQTMLNRASESTRSSANNGRMS